jgi:hypothetical protein
MGAITENDSGTAADLNDFESGLPLMPNPASPDKLDGATDRWSKTEVRGSELKGVGLISKHGSDEG